MTSGKSARR